jgi:hypothetical protein
MNETVSERDPTLSDNETSPDLEASYQVKSIDPLTGLAGDPDNNPPIVDDLKSQSTCFFAACLPSDLHHYFRS